LEIVSKLQVLCLLSFCLSCLAQTVHSLDLVASAPGVIACNMAHTPLGSCSCDVAVFSLALMGTDYGEYLVEAARLLKKGGKLWIAEVISLSKRPVGEAVIDVRA